MQCNSSGFFDADRGAQFGIVSYDWSNNKKHWAAAKPMNCEELLEQQAVQTKQAGGRHVFVYRNIVKALPWFSKVREKLNDPAYSGFFLKFDTTNTKFHVSPCAAEDHGHCSSFYHDQLQTPQVPTEKANHPDGRCVDYCDCGLHPCGEYLFDHRNGTMLREFLLQDVVLGALKEGVIDGLFLDDFWCSDLLCRDDPSIAGCPCNDPVQGPTTEIEPHSQTDMGLSDEDIQHITLEWNRTMTRVHQLLLNNNAYTWSLIPGQENANAMPLLLTSTACVDLLQEACREDSKWQQLPLLFGLSVSSQHELVQLQQDLAFFQLARGPYAYLGWGVWGMTWPFNPERAHGALPPLPHGVPLPKDLFQDYGEPTGVWEEVYDGVFVRDWTKARVQLNCRSFEAQVSFKDGVVLVG